MSNTNNPKSIIRILHKGTKLFRYDLECPPEYWSTEFKSLIYRNFDLGAKNKCGAFFFFNKKEEAVNVAKIVVDERREILDDNIWTGEVWLTETEIKDEMALLDLSNMKDVTDLYVTLWNNNIDVFTDYFFKIAPYMPSIPISKIKKDVVLLAEFRQGKNKNRVKANESKYNILNFAYGNNNQEKLRYALQQLTDFDNGIIFIETLKSIYLEGYIFKETNKDTIVLFESKKLKQPVHKKLEL